MQIVFKLVNKIIEPANQTPGIFIIRGITKIPGVWLAGAKILFTELKIFGPEKEFFSFQKSVAGHGF